MRSVCAYCGRDLSGPEPASDTPVSHGMCADCYAHFDPQWQGLSLGEYLDRFEVPVMVISAEGRLMAANQRLADWIGQPERDLHGLLGGEAFECQYARLPGGCGQTTHCATCAIRNSVNETLSSGNPLPEVEAVLVQAGRRRTLRLSTARLGEAVIVTVQEVAVDAPSRTPTTATR